jgi:hypothetical protein
MRTYLWVIFLIFSMMGVYIALLPVAAWKSSNPSVSSSGPF